MCAPPLCRVAWTKQLRGLAVTVTGVFEGRAGHVLEEPGRNEHQGDNIHRVHPQDVVQRLERRCGETRIRE
jgi:hypothetical protein